MEWNLLHYPRSVRRLILLTQPFSMILLAAVFGVAVAGFIVLDYFCNLKEFNRTHWR